MSAMAVFLESWMALPLTEAEVESNVQKPLELSTGV